MPAHDPVPTQVAFHFNVADKASYVCRLLRKAVHAGSRVIVTGAAGEIADLDRRLWTFAPQEFVAHCRSDAAPDMLQATPVVLAGFLDDPVLNDLRRQVLLNLGAEVPVGFERFERLIEVVSQEDADRTAARLRWRHYVEGGFTMVRHDATPS
jgi:DNA polymerase III subunit chi